jgi:hypothetical protein
MSNWLIPMPIARWFEGLLINNIHHKGGGREGGLGWDWLLGVVSQKLVFDSGRKVVNKEEGRVS